MLSFVERLGGKDRTFTLLSVDDLIALTRTLPAAGDIIDLRGLDLWSKNPEGAEWFLVKSLRKTEPMITRDEVRKHGSLLRRVNIANRIFTESIASGEESESPKVEGGTPIPPTGT